MKFEFDVIVGIELKHISASDRLDTSDDDDDIGVTCRLQLMMLNYSQLSSELKNKLERYLSIPPVAFNTTYKVLGYVGMLLKKDVLIGMLNMRNEIPLLSNLSKWTLHLTEIPTINLKFTCDSNVFTKYKDVFEKFDIDPKKEIVCPHCKMLDFNDRKEQIKAKIARLTETKSKIEIEIEQLFRDLETDSVKVEANRDILKLMS